MTSILKNKVVKFILLTFFWLTIWQILAMFVNQELVLPSVFTVLNTLGKLVRTNTFWLTCVVSVFRITIAYIFGIIIAIIISFLSCKYAFLKTLINPLVRICRSTPVASFSILALLWLAKKDVPILIVILMVFPIVYEAITNEYKQVDSELIEMANLFRLSLMKKIINIYIPSIMPVFLSAASSALGLSFKAGIAAEVLSLPSVGIGTNLYYSKVYLETSELFAWTFVLILISALIELLIKRLLRKGVLYDNQ